MAVDVPAAAKKPKTDSEGLVPEEQAKGARGKGRVKNPGGPRAKASRASNSPAVPPTAVPTAPQAAAPPAAFSAMTSGAGPTASMSQLPTGFQQQQQQLPPGHPMLLQQQAGNPAAPPSSALPPAQPTMQAINPAQAQAYINLKQNLVAQGITSEEQQQTIIDLVAQLQNPTKSVEEKMAVKQQLEITLNRAKQAASAALSSAVPGPQAVDGVQAASAQNAAPASQQLQQTLAQGIVSPATQPAATQPTAVAQQLLYHALNIMRLKQNIDIRQLFAMLTPESFEAGARDACRDQPEIINNILLLKHAFTQ
ncbi:hypothetical protein GGI04_005975, partial [Coemansia thaxteri]